MVVPLPYTLRTRYPSIAIAWTIILIPPIFLNLGLFYGLWYGTNLDRLLGLYFPFLLNLNPALSRDSTYTHHSPYTSHRHPRHLHHNRHNRTHLQTHQEISAIPTPERLSLVIRYLPMGLFPRSTSHLRPHLFNPRSW
jgi:hypothetical protein